MKRGREARIAAIREARIAAIFVFQRIRLRLNRVEAMHIELEEKLLEFLDQPIGEMMADRVKINDVIELARKVLKQEWETTKSPWKGFWNRLLRRDAANSN